MEEHIKTPSPSKDEISFLDLLRKLKTALNLFESISRKSKELSLIFAEVRKCNPILRDLVEEMEKNLQSVHLELLNKISSLTLSLLDQSKSHHEA